jgi:hypothetical protein
MRHYRSAVHEAGPRLKLTIPARILAVLYFSPLIWESTLVTEHRREVLVGYSHLHERSRIIAVRAVITPLMREVRTPGDSTRH